MQVTATGYLKKAARVFLIVLVVSLLVVFSAGDVLALFTNGGFESGDFTGWTKATYLNPGLTLPLPFTGADINRTAGGGDLTSVLGPFPALTQSDPNTGGVLKYPFSGQYSAVINYMGFNRNANAADHDGGRRRAAGWNDPHRVCLGGRGAGPIPPGGRTTLHLRRR
jgi:hypothetical protein